MAIPYTFFYTVFLKSCDKATITVISSQLCGTQRWTAKDCN